MQQKLASRLLASFAIEPFLVWPPHWLLGLNRPAALAAMTRVREIRAFSSSFDAVSVAAGVGIDVLLADARFVSKHCFRRQIRGDGQTGHTRDRRAAPDGDDSFLEARPSKCSANLCAGCGTLIPPSPQSLSSMVQAPISVAPGDIAERRLRTTWLGVI